MRFLHTGDLHIGKTMNEFSLQKDQEYILHEILSICKEKKVDAILLAGDIYDRAVPPAEAVELFDSFLSELVAEKLQVLMISGNHDSAQRIAFGEKIFAKQNVHIAAMQDGTCKNIMLTDEYGKIEFTLLPFVKAGMVGAKNMNEAVKIMLTNNREQNQNTSKTSEKHRKVLMTHYFVANAGKEPMLADTESSIYVGGLDIVDASLFAEYDYVALGHIHKPQRLGETNIYYAGTPLAYSFSEVDQEKSVLLVELDEKGTGKVEQIPLKPLHMVRQIKGKLAELIKEDVFLLADREDYIHVILTDQKENIGAMDTIRSVYPNTVMLTMEKDALRRQAETKQALELKEKPAWEIFETFYELVREQELGTEKKQIVKDTFEKVLEEMG